MQMRLWNKAKWKTRNVLPVDLPAAPINIAGIAIAKHPNDATNDNIWALPGDLDESTLWKYTCHGMPPPICETKDY